MDYDSIVARNASLMSAAVDEDLVILVPKSDNYLALDAVGRAIWERLAAPVSVSSLVADLQTSFAGEPERIAADVLAFLTELETEGMLTIASSPPA